MLWIKAFHVIFMVAWFAGLLYLPRLFVYHATTSDKPGIERFKVMENKLFYFIMTPAAMLSSVLGLWLLYEGWGYFRTQAWMWWKLAFVVILWIYHLYCGHLVSLFAQDNNHYSQRFYRYFNEVPSILLIVIIILVIVKP